jgi:hypothetical protein
MSATAEAGNRRVAADAGAGVAPPPQPSPASDLRMWMQARRAGKIASIQSYLDRFPNGRFAGTAKTLLTKLRAAPIRTAAASQETEAALALTPTDRTEILRRLGAQGYFDGLPNGAEFDDDARGAIGRWQGARELTESGYLNRLQFDKLMSEPRNVVRRGTAPPAETRRTERTGPFHSVWRYEVLPGGRIRPID